MRTEGEITEEDSHVHGSNSRSEKMPLDNIWKTFTRTISLIFATALKLHLSPPNFSEIRFGPQATRFAGFFLAKKEKRARVLAADN